MLFSCYFGVPGVQGLWGDNHCSMCILFHRPIRHQDGFDGRLPPKIVNMTWNLFRFCFTWRKPAASESNLVEDNLIVWQCSSFQGERMRNEQGKMQCSKRKLAESLFLCTHSTVTLTPIGREQHLHYTNFTLFHSLKTCSGTWHSFCTDSLRLNVDTLSGGVPTSM